jgi:hypothetical protein
MTEPDYLAQTAERLTSDERRAWLVACAAEARKRGVTHARATIHPKDAWTLFEGWVERPMRMNGDVLELDEGEPRWQVAAPSCYSPAPERGA